MREGETSEELGSTESEFKRRGNIDLIGFGVGCEEEIWRVWVVPEDSRKMCMLIDEDWKGNSNGK